MDSLPDVLFVVDVGHEHIAIHEARKLGIPVVAVVDTNCSPDGVDYLIPGNDDAMRAISLYAGAVADAVTDGKSAVPAVMVGEDDFVELDESGAPRKSAGRPGRAKPAANVRRKPSPAAPAEAVAEAKVAPEAATGEAAAAAKPAEISEAELDEPSVDGVKEGGKEQIPTARRRPVPGAGARRGPR